MYRIRKSIDLDFAHHIRGHVGACINIHGHTWKFEVGLEASELSQEGFVVDFRKLQDHVLKPCDQLLDHALAMGDETWADVQEQIAPVGALLLASRGENDGHKPVPFDLAGAKNHYPGGMKVAVFPFNPTSERIAEWLYQVAKNALEDDRVTVLYGRVYETLHPVEAVAEYWPSTS